MYAWIYVRTASVSCRPESTNCFARKMTWTKLRRSSVQNDMYMHALRLSKSAEMCYVRMCIEICRPEDDQYTYMCRHDVRGFFVVLLCAWVMHLRYYQRTYMHTYTYIRTCIYIHTCTYVCTHVHSHLHACIPHTHIYIYIYIYIYTRNIYIYIYIYTYIHTYTHTDLRDVVDVGAVKGCCVHTCTHTYIRTYIHTYIHAN
jgi:hypothetical protein